MPGKGENQMKKIKNNENKSNWEIEKLQIAVSVPEHMKVVEREGKRRATLNASFKLERSTDEGPEKTAIKFSISSEEPCLELCYFNQQWQRMYVRLMHKPEAVDLSRVKDGIPLRDKHGGDQVALLRPPVLREGKLGGDEIVWSASERAQVLRKDYEAGVRSEVSVEGDYDDEDLEVTGEMKDGVPVVRCTRWIPFAAALAVVTPADVTVGFGRSAEVATEPKTENKPQENKKDDAPAIITRSKKMNEEEKAAKEAAFKAANEVHSIIRDFNVPTDVSNKWLSNLEKGEADVNSIMREVLTGKFERRSTIAAIAAATDKNVQRQITSAPSGEAPAELANRFNLRRAIMSQLPEAVRAGLGCSKMDFGVERETQEEMLKVMRSVPGYENYAPRGVMIPWNLPVKREITVQSAGAGASLVNQQLRPDMFIDVLRNALVLAQAGATVLTGLVGDQKIPRKSAAASAGWTNGEVAVANSEMTLEQLTLTPRTVGAYSDMSRQALLQTTPAIDMLVMSDLMESTARAVQTGALLGSGATGQPTGIKTRVDSAGTVFTVSTAGTPTAAELLAADSVLGDGNVEDDGTIAWMLPRRLFNTMCALPWTSNAVNKFLAQRMNGKGAGTVIDIEAFLTNSVTKNYAFYGRWSDLVIAHWNAFELIVDPYSLSTKGALRIVGLQSMDIQVRYDKAFTYCATVGAA